MEWAAVTNKGRRRQTNEDAYLIVPERGLFAVADGLGGHAAGEVASRVALETFSAALGLEEGQDLPAALGRAAAAANEAVYRMAQSHPDYGGMGTTLTACVIQNEELYWVHVGASRGYLLRQEEIIQFTRDHSVFAELFAAGYLDEAEATAWGYRNVLTRAVGVEPAVEADTGRLLLAVGDTILLCTDGLTLHLDDPDILKIATHGAVSEQTRALVELALERGGEDNVTVVLVRITA